MTQIDPERIINSNPGVDRKKLAEALEAIEKLRKLGISGPKYDLIPPFSQKSKEAAKHSNQVRRGIRRRLFNASSVADARGAKRSVC